MGSKSSGEPSRGRYKDSSSSSNPPNTKERNFKLNFKL